MATPVSDIYAVPSGTTSLRFGNGAAAPPPTPDPDPVFAPPWDGAQTVNLSSGTADVVNGAVDIPSTFAWAAGYNVPSGITLTTIDSTHFRVDLASSLASGSYQIAVEATPI